MKLSSLEVIPYALPFRQPYVTARGSLRQRQMVLLRLRDEEGLVGLGEAVPLSLRGGTGLVEVVRELEALSGLPDAGAEAMRAACVGLSAPARCAVETALADLEARAAEARLSPAPVRDPHHDGASATPAEATAVACNATLVAGEPGAVAEQALAWAGEGFTTFKLKLGAGDDVAQVRAVREALGPGPRIRVDANAAWDAESARRILHELEPLDIELAEQPLATLEEMAALAAQTSIPLAADESVASPAEAELAASLGACRFTGIKLSKVGGLQQAVAIADLLPAYLSSALDGPVGIAAAAQVVQTLAQTDRPERLELAHGLATQRLFASTVAAVESELRNGVLHPPSGPGLGVEIDERALQAHRL